MPPAAVYARGFGYNDEHYYVTIDRHFDAELERWRAGGDGGSFARRFAQMASFDEYADELLSVHDSIDEAERAAEVAHAERCRTFHFVDLGFHSFGCRPTVREYEDDEYEFSEYESNDDLERLQRWCEQHRVDVPSLDAHDPNVRAAVERIAAASMEGELWLDYIDDDGAAPFAADLVVQALIATDRGDLVPDLWRSLVAETTYVGPAPAPEAGRSHTPSTEEPPRSGGFLKRLFGG